MNEPQARRWTAQKTKVQVSRSAQHNNLYIVTDQSGIGWYAVESSQTAMMAAHPPIKSTIQWK